MKHHLASTSAFALAIALSFGAGAVAQTQPTAPQATPPAATDTLQDRSQDRMTPGADTQRVMPSGGAQMQNQGVQSEGRMAVDVSNGIQPVNTYLTSDLIGATVEYSGTDESGTLRQLVLDDEGYITHAVIGHGGVAGVGEKQVILPYQELTVTHNEDGALIQANVTPEAIAEMPDFRTQEEARSESTTAPAAQSGGTAPAPAAD